MKERYIQANNRGNKTRAHRVIAEKVLGRPLSAKIHIHHIDGDGRNNTHSNLVICPDAAYHRRIHARERALDACGDSNWLRCRICKGYDDPKNMVLWSVKSRPNSMPLAAHRKCTNDYQKTFMKVKRPLA